MRPTSRFIAAWRFGVVAVALIAATQFAIDAFHAA
jgi:hypothetical protein